MNLRKTSVVTLVAVAALSVASCGTAVDLAAGQPGDTLTKANFAGALATATSQSRSVHINGTFTVHGQQVSMTVDASKTGPSIRDTTLAATISLGGMAHVQVRVVGGALYVNRSQLPMVAPASGKPWVKIPLTDSSHPLGAMIDRITGSLRPDLLAKAFQSVSTLTKVGTATVDGVATTHYRVSVDLARARSVLGMPAAPRMSMMPRTISYDVWLDASNRPVMVTMSNLMFTMNLHFSRWGEPVHVVAPPPSQVGTFSR